MRRNKTYNGLGGLSSHASSMISSLKSNFRKRDVTFLKGRKNKTTFGKINSNKKATPHQLKNIREKLRKENSKKLKITILLILIALFVLIYFVGFIKF